MPVLYNREVINHTVREIIAIGYGFSNKDICDWMKKVIMRNLEKYDDYIFECNADNVFHVFDVMANIAISKGEKVYNFSSAHLGDDISNVSDWIDSKNSRELDKVLRMSWREAVAASEKWHASLAKQKRVKATETLPVYIDCGEYKWHWLKTPEDLDHEGKAMGNCVGGGGYDGNVIMSLRDAHGVSHVTADVEGGYIGEMKGHGNSTVNDKYLPMCKVLERRINNDWAINKAPIMELDGIYVFNDGGLVTGTAKRVNGLIHADEGYAVERIYQNPTPYSFIAGTPNFRPAFVTHKEVWKNGVFDRMVLTAPDGRTAVIDSKYQVVSHDFKDDLEEFKKTEAIAKKAALEAQRAKEREELERIKSEQKLRLQMMTGTARIMEDPDTPVGTVVRDVELIDIPEFGRRWVRLETAEEYKRDPDAFVRMLKMRSFEQQKMAVLRNQAYSVSAPQVDEATQRATELLNQSYARSNNFEAAFRVQRESPFGDSWKISNMSTHTRIAMQQLMGS